jgi:hypothetical protein
MIVDNVHIHIRTHSLLYETGLQTSIKKILTALGVPLFPAF